MKPSEILKAGLELFGPSGEHWTQNEYAKDANGSRTDRTALATCFCGFGAIRMAAFSSILIPYGLKSRDEFNRAQYLLNRVVDDGGAGHDWFWINWQDTAGRTFAEVRAKFLEAIALAEREEQQVAA